MLHSYSKAFLLISIFLFTASTGVYAEPNEKKGARPIKINSPKPQRVDHYALDEHTPTDPTASPNPRLDMVIMGSNDEPVIHAIPLMEDSTTDLYANSAIFDAVPPTSMDGITFENPRWAAPPTTMWTIDEVRRKQTSLGKSNNNQFQAGFKHPGEYLLSCFTFRDFVYTYKEREMRLTAISSKGISCFVADCTPPSIELKITEYETENKSLITCQESPTNKPIGQKTWEFFYEGNHFDGKEQKSKSGRLAGDLQQQTKIDLTKEKTLPPISLKKGLTYLLDIDVKDNYGVATKEWTLLNLARRNILVDVRATKFSFAQEDTFYGRHTFSIYVKDHGGNDLELRIPVEIID